MRQTEEFLRGVQADEESFERQRQEHLFRVSFNSMIHSSRLRLAPSSAFKQHAPEVSNFSAPVTHGFEPTSNGFFSALSTRSRSRFVSVDRELACDQIGRANKSLDTLADFAPHLTHSAYCPTKTWSALDERISVPRGHSLLSDRFSAQDSSSKAMSASILSSSKSPYFLPPSLPPSSITVTSSTISTTRARRSVSLLGRESSPPSRLEHHDQRPAVTEDESEFDAEMDAYRPPAYVPRISTSGASSLRLARSRSRTLPPTTSLHGGSSSCNVTQTSSEVVANSKLSALEERINERKRRTSELISAVGGERSSCRLQSCERKLDEGSSAAIVGSGAADSADLRDESMESRIRRKSFCVRLSQNSSAASFNGASKLSLEKWRESRRASLTATTGGGSLASTNTSINKLLARAAKLSEPSSAKIAGVSADLD